MNVLGNKKIGFGIKSKFDATGGVGPYTFSLEAGSQGTITPQGLYTAPEVAGDYQKATRAKVKVVDSTPVTPQELIFDVSVLSPLALVADILENFMGLQNGQVMIYNQKYDIPKDTKIYIAINFVSNKPYGNVKKSEEIAGDLYSIQEINNGAVIDLDIMCRTMEALERKEEMLLALKSDYSINQQAFNSFYVSNISQSFLNLTTEEGPALLYRFKTTVALQYTVRRTKKVDYYDQFREPELLTDA